MDRAEWVEKYKPLEFSFGSEGGLHENLEEDGVVFTRIGKRNPEFGEVVRAPADRVWTELEQGGLQFISSGYHVVDSVGYYITAVPFEPADHVEVTLWGCEDEIDMQKDQFLHMLDAEEERISPLAKQTLTAFINAPSIDILKTHETERVSFPGLEEEELSDTVDYQLQILESLDYIDEDCRLEVLDILKRGSMLPPPKPKAQIKSPSM